MIKTERKYWLNGVRFDHLYNGRHFLHVYFRIGNFGFSLCQPNRGNDIITIYKLEG